LMAINPVGLYNACDPEMAFSEGCDMASLVQRDLDMVIPGVIAGAVAEAMRPNATVDGVLETAIRLSPKRSFVTFDERRFDNLRDTIKRAVEIGRSADDVFAAREGLYAEMLQYAAIDPQEVFALTFGILAASDGEIEQAVIGGANIGRDADTISSLNGQICGALGGASSIPGPWMAGLERGSGWPRFVEVVDRMTRLVEQRSMAIARQADDLSQLTAHQDDV
ncbi:MAG: hypothetical protein GF393_05105, partial [Armatimonadia bacterium]|nr:hypothetical protein [Armatimonadia bacterium]